MEVQKIVNWFKEHEDERNEYDALRQDAADLVNPRRYDMTSYSKNQKGKRRGVKIYDNLPNLYLDIWVDGMQGFMVSPSLNWFRSVINIPALRHNDQVRKWLQEYDEVMYDEYRRSNFYPVLSEWFRDAGSIGTAGLYIEEDLENASAVCHVIHPRELYISENFFGQVDVVFRKFQLTARQAHKKFGDALPQGVIQQATSPGTSEVEHEFLHACFENKERVIGSISNGKKYKSVYIYYGASDGGTAYHSQQEIVRESGYDYFPFAIWRYRKNSDEIYGYSPAMDSIITCSTLNQQARLNLDAGNRAVDPPMNVHESQAGREQSLPGGRNYFSDPREQMSPTVTGTNLPWGLEQQERLENQLRMRYNVDLFMMIAQSEREQTATEIMAKQGEKAVLMAPKVDRLQHEGLIPVHEIFQSIAFDARRLPPAPDIVLEYTDGKIDVEFIGPMAQAQRSFFETRNIEQAMAKLGGIAELNPSVLNKVRWFQTTERLMESSGMPQELIVPDDEAAAVTAQQNQQAQAEQQAQMMIEGAKAVPSLQQPTQEGSPLEAIANES